MKNKTKIVLTIIITLLAISIYIVLDKTEQLSKITDIGSKEAMNVEEVEDIQIYSDDIIYGDVDLNGKVTRK